jgi:hypothetical protein
METTAQDQTATAKRAPRDGEVTRRDPEAVRRARRVRERDDVEPNPSGLAGRSEKSAGLGGRGELGGADEPP